MRFENKVAVITGGAHGIGKANAEEFEKAGAKVCIIDKADDLPWGLWMAPGMLMMFPFSCVVIKNRNIKENYDAYRTYCNVCQ